MRCIRDIIETFILLLNKKESGHDLYFYIIFKLKNLLLFPNIIYCHNNIVIIIKNTHHGCSADASPRPPPPPSPRLLSVDYTRNFLTPTLVRAIL